MSHSISDTDTSERAVVYAGLLATIISTASGFISTGTAAFVRDLSKALGKEVEHAK